MGDIIRPHGGYAGLKAFQTAEIIYDATVVFCGRFLDRRSRTIDQMVQAARYGVQNIAEGSKASATSKKTEIKLTNVARASLEELLADQCGNRLLLENVEGEAGGGLHGRVAFDQFAVGAENGLPDLFTGHIPETIVHRYGKAPQVFHFGGHQRAIR